MKARNQLPKLAIILGVVLVYLAVAATLILLVNNGTIPQADPPEDTSTVYEDDNAPLPATYNLTQRKEAAISYVEEHLTQPNGHINTYEPLREQTIQGANDTNSEAISYSLQIAAQANNQEIFDRQLDYLENYLQHPRGFLMWRVEEDYQARGEGRNNAHDADLRVIRALYIAHDRWGEERYLRLIDEIATGLELVAITPDNRLAAYGGMSGDTPWMADESYLAYSDFQALERLANTRGGAWVEVEENMRQITLDAQLENGLYNSEYWPTSGYGTGIDGGVYSINSLWIMVRFAESNDEELMQSAREGLEFYREQYAQERLIYAAYTSSGEPAVDYEAIWAYALVARAAHALGDDSFGEVMITRMLEYQDTNQQSESYGAFIEGDAGDERAGQFTIQESILTLQEATGNAPRFI